MIPCRVFEDFSPDVGEVRAAVIAGGFSTETGPDGAPYTGVSRLDVPHWYARIAELIKAPVTPRLDCFRLNLAGELPHSWIHSDDICAEWASVLYLNLPEQCRGGTAFWRHRALGMNRLWSRSELEAAGMDADAFSTLMTREWKSLEFWELTDLIAMRFARFVTYPTCYFHSRFPHEAFGAGPEDGRLVWVCFYDRG